MAESQQAFLDECLNPHLIALEQEADAKLRTETEKRLGRIYFEFERSALLSMDKTSENELITSQVNNGLISEEYGRRRLNLPDKVEDETYRRMSNVIVEGLEPVAPPPAMPLPDEGIPETTETETAKDKQISTQITKDLTRGILTRLVNRVKTSVEKKHYDLSDHRAIMVENLKAYPQAETFVDNLIERVQPELDAVLPEQRAEILRSLDIEDMVQTLCTK